MFDSLPNLLKQFFLPFLGFTSIFYLCIRIFETRRRLLHRSRFQLANKSVLITGASSGLGYALAEEFYTRGAKLILASRNVEKLREIKQSLTSKNQSLLAPEPEIIRLDLNDESSIDEVSRLILKSNRLDILINNAGMSMRESCEETSINVHRMLMQVNYFGHVQLTQKLLGALLQSPCPYLVNISSVQGRIAIPYRSAYTASKHAFQAYFDSLRAELSAKKSPIKVLVVSPGYIQTNLSLNAVKGDGRVYGRMDETTKKGMKPEVAAKLVVEAMLDGGEELILANLDARVAMVIRLIMPNLYFWIMKKRAETELKNQ